MPIILDPNTGISAPSLDLVTPLPVVDGGSKLKQIATYQTGAVVTSTTVIPVDDTIPQNTEGTELMSLAITPSNALSTLEISVKFNGAISATGARITLALFQDANTGALAATTFYNYDTGMNNFTLTHKIVAGTTSSTTFKLRAGSSSAMTMTFNGVASARLFGGVTDSSITIKEYLP